MGAEPSAADSARQQGSGLEGFLEEVMHVLILRNKLVLSRLWSVVRAEQMGEGKIKT